MLPACVCVFTVAIGISKVPPSSQHCCLWLRSHSVSAEKYGILLEVTEMFDRLEVISGGESQDCWGRVCEGGTWDCSSECSLYSFAWRRVGFSNWVCVRGQLSIPMTEEQKRLPWSPCRIKRQRDGGRWWDSLQVGGWRLKWRRRTFISTTENQFCTWCWFRLYLGSYLHVTEKPGNYLPVEVILIVCVSTCMCLTSPHLESIRQFCSEWVPTAFEDEPHLTLGCICWDLVSPSNY